ncbi:MAG: Crp/Fnr family transcriptional regulator [Ignavibacteria bacterium]|nr:Crp/Fnr family transcriptional regulator [Ignavibacteria bacterium]
MNIRTKLWYLENINLFDGMSKDKMDMLAGKLKMQKIVKNEIIYFASEPSLSIFLLKEGKVKLSRISEDGKEIITAILNPGEIFGELALSGSSGREDTAIAMDDAVICTISKDSLEEILLENPKLNLKITKLIGLKLQRVERDLETLVFKDSNQRVIGFLSKYAERFGKKIGTEIFIKSPFTHQDIANLTATSRQTVSTLFNQLKSKGLIDFSRNKIIIKDPAKLSKLK